MIIEFPTKIQTFDFTRIVQPVFLSIKHSAGNRIKVCGLLFVLW